ncbi:MAG: ABC transporter ATP-binding protein/permease [Anaerolineales bacterium]|nr:ABC transporter ATP-binding protein/permease [Anaerolineales bacterium]
MFGGTHGLSRAMGSDTLKPQNVGVTLRRFAVYFRPYWFLLILAGVLLIGATWAQVESPKLIGQLVDCYLTPSVVSAIGNLPLAQEGGIASGAVSNCSMEADPAVLSTAERLAGLGRVTLMIIGLALMASILTGLTVYLMNWSGQHVLRQLRVDLFKHLHSLSIGFYSEQEAGDLMSRITNDTDTIQQVFTFGLVNVISGVLLIVWIGSSMFQESFVYALVSLAVVPIMIIVTLWFSSQARKAFRQTRLEMGSVNAELQETISAVREVQAFSREQENIDNFMVTNAANRDANIRAVSYTSALAPTLEALGYLALAIVAGVGGILLLRGQPLFGTVLSLGLVITFLTYVQRFNQPIQQISVLWTNIQSAVAGGERIFGLLDIEPLVEDLPDAQEVPTIQGKVEFQNVFAAYKEESVLNGISFDVEPGQTIAIVGPTGAGKTTLVNLIPRFYDVTGGAILIDGLDIRYGTKESLREQIGIVLQDTFLFSTSVMENIRFGRPDATDEEVINAAKLAHADTFIARLPEGYETVLGERGSGLSQGQRQLLSIARAALSDPRILILDEATSSVDTRTERLIQQALERLLENRTSFVIAHRLSTIRNADLLLVMDEGRIIERGKHEELLAEKGFYFDLYMSQFRRVDPNEDPGKNRREVTQTPVASD